MNTSIPKVSKKQDQEGPVQHAVERQLPVQEGPAEHAKWKGSDSQSRKGQLNMQRVESLWLPVQPDLH